MIFQTNLFMLYTSALPIAPSVHTFTFVNRRRVFVESEDEEEEEALWSWTGSVLTTPVSTISRLFHPITNKVLNSEEPTQTLNLFLLSSLPPPHPPPPLHPPTPNFSTGERVISGCWEQHPLVVVHKGLHRQEQELPQA